MTSIQYTVRNRRGEIERGVLSNMTEEEVLSYLQDKGFVVINIMAAGEGVSAAKTELDKSAPKFAQRKFHKKVKLDDLIVFSRQLSTLLEAGVTLLRGLTLLSVQLESLTLYRAVEAVRKDVEAGSSFKNALAKHPKVFSQYWVSLVETGEATGQLSTVMDELARYLEASGRLRRSIVSALAYPIVLLTAALGAIVFFMVFITPVFAEIFEGAGMELPAMTRMVMVTGHIIRHKSWLLLIILAGAVYAFRQYARTRAGKLNLDTLALSLPVYGVLLRRLSTARFASSLSTLVKSGTPIVNSLDILVRTADNRVVQNALQKVRDSVKEGKGMSGPLAQNNVFPILVSQMVAVGEETGELANMLTRVAQFYEERVTATVERMTALFEPIMLLFMGVVVGFLVISMFLPVFQMGQMVR